MSDLTEYPSFLFVQAGFSGGQTKPGVAFAPSALLSSPLLSHLSFSLHGLDRTSCESLEQEFSRQQIGKVRNLSLVSEFNRRLKEEIFQLKRGEKILVAGGDHSIAVGSIAAMCSREPGLKVVWIDAHADINTVGCTHSGNLHGCPLSFLLGVDESRMSWLRPCLKPENLVYLGLRDVDPPEVEILERLKIRAYYMSDVRRLGMETVVREIGEFVGEAPLHVSLDVDGIDPEYTGATGTPVSGGLSFEDTQSLFLSLLPKHWVSLDVAEVNLQEGSPEAQALTLDYTLRLISTYLSR